MRRLLVVALAGLFGFATPAVAQNAVPVLIGQDGPTGGQGLPSGSGQDALAQVPDDNQGGGPNPLLIGGGLLIAGGLAAILIANSNRNKNPVSP